MPDASSTHTTQLSPLGQAAHQDGIVMTQMLIVADVKSTNTPLPGSTSRIRPAHRVP